ncbi:MAG: hypothetical protein CL916_01105 [Deltaproteobacteria bacterium]|nr:hypothetical protein [Deltaproteobacteria bacterium]
MSSSIFQPRSYAFLLSLSSCIILYGQACTNESTVNNHISPLVPEYLKTVGHDIVLPSLESFQAEITNLQEQVQGASTSEDLDNAQETWTTVMQKWQHIEMMQIGPIGSSLTVVGGMDQRDDIYSWPTTDGCIVFHHLVEESWKEEDFFDNQQVYSYGLDALEVLFFSDISECPQSDPLVSDGIWESIEAEIRTQKKIGFAQELIDQLNIQTDTIISSWSPEGGDFAGMLSMQNKDSPYSTSQEALNAIYDALFYLEKMTKDKKLAQPLGIKDCTQDLCLDDLEGRLSERSLSHIIENITAFRLLFTGGEGIGLDDILTDLGHEDIGQKLLSDIDQTLLLSEQLEGSLEESLQDRKEVVLAFYYSLRNVTTTLKVNLAMILSMQIPAEAAGDND